MREILLTLQPSLRCTPFLLTSSIKPECQLDSYPGALGQVLTNLINNAVLHGLEGCSVGTIRLSAECSGANVEIRVSDDGRGIAPELQKRIFEPFYTSKRGSGGTGLGLHICQGIVNRVLGGEMSVQSAVGCGSTFVLLFPRVAPDRKVADEDVAPLGRA